MSEKIALKIIVIADSSEEAKTVATTLNQVGFNVKGKHAATMEGLKQALNHQLWDIILIATPPAQLSVKQTCETIEGFDLTTPVVSLSQTTSDSERLAAMHNGARDCVCLDQAELLGLIVKRELSRPLMENSRQLPPAQRPGQAAAGAPPDSQILEDEKLWLTRIETALSEDSFKLVYQPIVNLNAEPAPNYEVLLRMIDEKGRELAPGSFIGPAEKSGLIQQIDRWVIRHAIGELQKRLTDTPESRFFIKLSGTSIQDDGLISWINEQLHESELAGHRLVFELTAADCLQHAEHASRLLKNLKLIQCGGAIDHIEDAESHEFWQGLDPDYIKISGRLIRNLAENQKDQETITRIAGYAKSRKILTIAQFVQDPTSLAFLWQRGINYIQGYYLQRPDENTNYDFSAEE